VQGGQPGVEGGEPTATGTGEAGKVGVGELAVVAKPPVPPENQADGRGIVADITRDILSSAGRAGTTAWTDLIRRVRDRAAPDPDGWTRTVVDGPRRRGAPDVDAAWVAAG
jgi:hypothetical protein